MIGVKWGPTIRVNGCRPEWIRDEDYVRFRKIYHGTATVACASELSQEDWAGIRNIDLPVDHPMYHPKVTAPAQPPEELPADWALLRAYDEIFGPNTEVPGAEKQAAVKRTMHGFTFARYIEKNEEAPVDPLLVEARELIAKELDVSNPGGAQEFREGQRDHTAALRATLAALHRGIEIGRTQG